MLQSVITPGWGFGEERRGGSHSISQTIVQRIDQSLVLFPYQYNL